MTGSVTDTVRGKVSGGTMTGTYATEVAVRDASGAQVDSCSRSTTFKLASAKSRVYGGRTSQDEPVVAELNSRGKAIKHFHIGWRSTCSGGGIAQYGDTLTNFGLVGGRFGDDYTSRFRLDDGTQEVDVYHLAGKLKPTSGTGSFSLKTTLTPPDGSAPATCDTGKVSFKLASG
jgi:hypothetical protein